MVFVFASLFIAIGHSLSFKYNNEVVMFICCFFLEKLNQTFFGHTKNVNMYTHVQ